jgi:two-component system response regulator FixJ
MDVVSPVVHIVEDDDSVRESLRAVLETYDLPVLVYRSGEEFLRHDCAGRQCCVLLDVNLPSVSGIDVLNRLRERAGLELPVVIMSGHGDEMARRQALEAGATLVLEKPFDGQHLAAELRYLLHLD